MHAGPGNGNTVCAKTVEIVAITRPEGSMTETVPSL